MIQVMKDIKKNKNKINVLDSVENKRTCKYERMTCRFS